MSAERSIKAPVHPDTTGGGQAAAMLAQAWEAFSRDFDTLLQTAAGKWVAYHGATRECLGDSPSAVYQECLRRKIAPEELFVELVYPGALEEPTVFLPPAELPEDEQ